MTEIIQPIPARLKNVAVGGHVAGADQIIDDETGLTLDKVTGGALEEKTYTSGSDNGMGRVVLRKNLVEGVNTLIQTMINKSNTIYVIQYDFTLGEDITVPANCVLEFTGGSVSAGGNDANTINGNGGTFNYSVGYNIFNSCNILNFNIPYIDIRWFGAKSDLQIENVTDGEGVVTSQNVTGTDCHDALAKAIEISNTYDSDNLLSVNGAVPVKLIGSYYLATKVSVSRGLRLEGTYYGSRREDVMPNLYIAGGIIAFEMATNSQLYENNITIKNLCVFSTGNYTFPLKALEDNLFTSVFLDYTCMGAPSRPGLIAESMFQGFFAPFYFHAKYVNGETVYGNLDVRNNVFDYNLYAIRTSIDKYVQDHIPWYDPTLTSSNHPWKDVLTQLNIHDNVLEGSGRYALQLYGTWGGLNICDNIIEGNRGAIDIVTDYGIINIERNYLEADNNDVNPIDGYDEDFSIRVIAPYLAHSRQATLSIINNVDESGSGRSRVAPIIVRGCFNNATVKHNGQITVDLSDLKTYLHSGLHYIPTYPSATRKFIPTQYSTNNGGNSPVDIVPEIINGVPVYTIGSDGTNNTKLTCRTNINIVAAVGTYMYIAYGVYLKNGENLPLKITNSSDSWESQQDIYALDRGDGWYTVIQKVYIKNAVNSGGIRIWSTLKREIKVTDIYVFLETTNLPALGLFQTPSSGTTTVRDGLLVPAGFTFFDITLGKNVVYNGTTWVNVDGTPLS